MTPLAEGVDSWHLFCIIHGGRRKRFAPKNINDLALLSFSVIYAYKNVNECLL
jgi:hypothetical protein